MIVGPLSFQRLQVGSTYEFKLNTVAIRTMYDAALSTIGPRRTALPLAGRDADDPGPFSRVGPRSDRRGAGDDRPNLERALQPQNARRANPLPRSRRRTKLPEHAQGNDFRRHAEDSQGGRRAGLVRERLFRQRRRRSASTTSTTSSSRSKRTITPRPWSRTAAPTRASAASSATRWAPAWAPSRSATRTCSALPRPTRPPNRSRPACSIRAASSRASSPASAITATAWAFPPSTARSTSIRATWAIRWSIAATSA